MQHESSVPFPFYIQQDYRLLIKNMGVVYHNDGKMVPGIANRDKHQVDKVGSNKWGGVCIK